MGRDENIEIFEDTLLLCRENEIIEKATNASKDEQKLILESDKLRIRRNDIYDTSRPKLMQAQNWFKVNVITCAAPNLRQRSSNSYNSGDGNVAMKITDKKLLQIHEKRLRRILDVAYQYGNEVIILGAFGCGAFVNNPTVVATAAKNVVKDYLHKFKTIEFAVYCNPKDDTNYRTFKRTLS